MSRLTLIVAATKTNGIGQSGGLPWRLAKEMSYFARTTTSAPDGYKNAVIMGRNTWESIPPKFRPLPNRVNVIVSRNKDYALLPEGAKEPAIPPVLQPDLGSALHRLSNVDESSTPIHRRFVIGGESLYAEALALPASPGGSFVDRILLTRVLSPAFEACDVFMPDFLSQTETEVGGPWRRASHGELQEWVGGDIPEGVQEEKGIQYEFQMWVRNES
ncbi:hypothetical protein EWM64_g9803 [Hericium alpestre]|uniref:Dihydrofolate reductase n=1 Tax=Hericium alpestre TaxID=135208 RepID=A0A4Y9ZKR9_9AGAM|nr:hypothetical protein EWM64_g9803 [Hericium alpestre]